MSENYNNPFQFFQEFEEGSEVKPTFSHISLRRQLEEGKIDKNDYRFLKNILDVYQEYPDILKDVYEFRKRTNRGDIPDADEFVTMQNLGCRNYPFGLDLTGLILPEVKLNRAKIGRNLKMCFVTVEKDVDQILMEVKGNVDMTGLKAGGDIIEDGMKTGGGVLQQEMEAGGDIRQTGIVSGGSIDQRGIKARNVYHIIAKVRGHIDMRGARCEKLDQREAEIDGGTELKGAQIPTVYQGSPDD